jgi:hypothetical protein
MTTNELRVENYNLKTASGRHIRVATKVTNEVGDVVRFIEKLSKREAIANALLVLNARLQS